MLVYGQDAEVASWVSQRLKIGPYTPGLYRAIGVTHNGRLIGGIVYNNFYLNAKEKPLSVEMAIATIDKRWCTKHNLRELFSYPFTQLEVGRVQATCHRKAKRVRATLKRLGFSFEGICREAHPHGGDAALYSLLKHECKWINYGKILTISTSSAESSSDSGSANAIQ